MSLAMLDKRLLSLRDSVVNKKHILGREIELAATIAIGNEMGATSGNSIFNDDTKVRAKKSTKLMLRSGKLYKSFLGGKDSLTKTTINQQGISTEIGSKLPYAEIQDTGGVIQATPVVAQRKSKTGKVWSKQTYRMAQFFWYKFRETKNTYWRSLAMKVERDGFVTIKPTHYFEKAMVEFKKNYHNVVIEWLADAVRTGQQ